MPSHETPRMLEAYREFLKLGINRSYETLHERLIELWGEDTPTAVTLRSWGASFGWQARAIDDDEIINRRAMERLRDKLSSEIEDRRKRRLTLSDVQLNAALKAMLIENPDTGEATPRDLLTMHPQVLRAVNDTIRLAADIQRLDQGMPTARIGGAPMDMADPQTQVRVMGQEALDELTRFIGIVPDEPLDDEEDETLMLPAPMEESA